jgi:hypothetical protein
MENNIDLELLRREAELYKQTFAAYAKIPKTTSQPQTEPEQPIKFKVKT